MQSVQAAVANDCSVVEAPLCCDVAATVFVGESSALVTGAAGDATIVLGDNGGCAYAATDSKDATNAKGMGKPDGGSACAATDFQDATNSKGMGNIPLQVPSESLTLMRFRGKRATGKLAVSRGHW